MSIRVMSDVWRFSKATGGDLLVLLAIADFADDKGLAWPAVETIANKARMSDRNVRKILRRLEKAGDLTVDHRRRNESNYYRVTLGEERQEWLFERPANPVKSSARPEPQFSLSGTAVQGDPEPQFSQTINEPSGNHHQTNSGNPVDQVFEAWEHEHKASLAFIERWQSWVDARKARKRPISAIAAKQQLALLATLTLEEALESIDASVRNDWTGLFRPRSGGSNPKQRRASFA